MLPAGGLGGVLGGDETPNTLFITSGINYLNYLNIAYDFKKFRLAR
jgi:hypothetical protein